MMLYMIVGFISILLIPIFRLRLIDKVGEKTVFRITNLVSVTLVLWLIYQDISPGLLNSSILDLVLVYLVVVALVGIIVMSQVVIFLVVGRFWEKIQHYPSSQFILDLSRNYAAPTALLGHKLIKGIPLVGEL
jgi:uncharacterized membrane protein